MNVLTSRPNADKITGLREDQWRELVRLQAEIADWADIASYAARNLYDPAAQADLALSLQGIGTGLSHVATLLNVARKYDLRREP